MALSFPPIDRYGDLDPKKLRLWIEQGRRTGDLTQQQVGELTGLVAGLGNKPINVKRQLPQIVRNLESIPEAKRILSERQNVLKLLRDLTQSSSVKGQGLRQVGSGPGNIASTQK